ncbi:hypothetical protein OHB01_14295 [Microbispora hainanensis]|uniref:hypothetical protein n=1 Tax=Microbispora hainanensis TaxID=568844 RepID=UPI002E2A29B0|nr:hypothetical protein [Microbispora hainanensis]
MEVDIPIGVGPCAVEREALDRDRPGGYGGDELLAMVERNVSVETLELMQHGFPWSAPCLGVYFDCSQPSQRRLKRFTSLP